MLSFWCLLETKQSFRILNEKQKQAIKKDKYTALTSIYCHWLTIFA